MQRIFFWPAIVMTVALVGCGQKPPDVYKVTGTVTLEGKPLEGARVTLHMDRAQGNAVLARRPSGVTDEEGRVTIQYQLNESTLEGAPVGSYRITVAQFKDDGSGADETAEDADAAMEKEDEAELKKMARRVVDEEESDEPDEKQDFPTDSLLPLEYGNPTFTPFTTTVTESDENSFTVDLKKRFPK